MRSCFLFCFEEMYTTPSRRFCRRRVGFGSSTLFSWEEKRVLEHVRGAGRGAMSLTSVRKASGFGAEVELPLLGCWGGHSQP